MMGGTRQQLRQLIQLLCILVTVTLVAAIPSDVTTSTSTPTTTKASQEPVPTENLVEDTEVIQMMRRQQTKCNETTCVIKFFDETIKPFYFVGDCRAEKVKQIHFSDAKSTELPSEIFEVAKHLQLLSINGSQIEKLLEGSFKDAKSLLEVYVANNSVVELGRKAFEGAHNLITINLNGNRISKVDRDAFQRLTKLRVLNLANNLIQTLDSKTFADNPRLFSLELSGNRIRQLDSNIFHTCEFMAWLYLNDNQLDQLHLRFKRNSLFWITVDDNEIDELRLDVDESNRLNEYTYIAANRNKIRKLKISSKYNVRNLYLENNEYIDLYEIMPMSTLRELRLGNNNLSHINIFAFENMRHLEILYLHNTNLRGVRAEMFNSQGKLKVLHIGYNRLGFIDLRFLNHLKSLEQLHIDGNDLTTLNVENINEWLPALKRIEIRDNPWSCRNLKFIMSYLTAFNVSLVSTETNDPGNVHGIRCEDNEGKIKVLELELEELQQKLKDMTEVFATNMKLLRESDCCNFTTLKDFTHSVQKRDLNKASSVSRCFL